MSFLRSSGRGKPRSLEGGKPSSENSNGWTPDRSSLIGFPPRSKSNANTFTNDRSKPSTDSPRPRGASLRSRALRNPSRPLVAITWGRVGRPRYRATGHVRPGHRPLPPRPRRVHLSPGNPSPALRTQLRRRKAGNRRVLRVIRHRTPANQASAKVGPNRPLEVCRRRGFFSSSPAAPPNRSPRKRRWATLPRRRPIPNEPAAARPLLPCVKTNPMSADRSSGRRRSIRPSRTI